MLTEGKQKLCRNRLSSTSDAALLKSDSAKSTNSVTNVTLQDIGDPPASEKNWEGWGPDPADPLWAKFQSCPA